MKIKFLIFLSLLFVVGCEKPAQSLNNTSNPNFQVEFLFEHDGVKVYRFTDQGSPRYFVDARGQVTWSEKHGKTTVKMEIPTEE